MITNKKDFIEYLLDDLQIAKIEKWKWYYKFKYTIIHFQRLLRKVEYYNNCKKGFTAKIYLLFIKYRLKKKSQSLGLTIPVNVFKKGLSIAHYGSIVVNPKARVGKNCRIHTATNIGEVAGKTPIIGDNVYIGPGVVIYGEITIGNNVSIGANSVVNKSFPDNVSIAGAPARIISNKNFIWNGH